MRRIFFVMLASTLALAACGGDAASSGAGGNEPIATVPAEYAGKTNPLGADAAGKGGEIFKTNCEMCHGPQGHGDGPAGQALDPKPRNLVELQPKVGDDFLFWRIREGKPGTSMVAWKGILSDEQIWQVVVFIRTLK